MFSPRNAYTNNWLNLLCIIYAAPISSPVTTGFLPNRSLISPWLLPTQNLLQFTLQFLILMSRWRCIQIFLSLNYRSCVPELITCPRIWDLETYFSDSLSCSCSLFSVKITNPSDVVSPFTCFFVLNMITIVISPVYLIPVDLFTLVTIESQFDSYEFGAVPQQLTAIQISLSRINFL